MAWTAETDPRKEVGKSGGGGGKVEVHWYFGPHVPGAALKAFHVSSSHPGRGVLIRPIFPKRRVRLREVK